MYHRGRESSERERERCSLTEREAYLITRVKRGERSAAGRRGRHLAEVTEKRLKVPTTALSLSLSLSHCLKPFILLLYSYSSATETKQHGASLLQRVCSNHHESIITQTLSSSFSLSSVFLTIPNPIIPFPLSIYFFLIPPPYLLQQSSLIISLTTLLQQWPIPQTPLKPAPRAMAQRVRINPRLLIYQRNPLLLTLLPLPLPPPPNSNSESTAQV